MPDFFGTSVAISGSRVVVGAPYHPTLADEAGTVYVYDLSSAAPTIPILTLNDPAAAQGYNFGGSVAMSGSRLVIGAPQGTNTGRAYVYDLSSPTPTVPVVRLQNPEPGWEDQFGRYVTISGTIVAVQGNVQFGLTYQMYIYDISRPTPGVAIATFPYYGGAAITGWTLLLGAGEVIYVFSPSEPGLTIAPASPASATISWPPADWPQFVLQYNDSLAPDSWVNAPSGASNPITVSSTNRARFYRLFSP